MAKANLMLVRFRCRLQKALYQRMHVSGEVLGLNDVQMVEFCVAIGLRFLEMSVVQPLSAELLRASEVASTVKLSELEGELSRIKRAADVDD